MVDIAGLLRGMQRVAERITRPSADQVFSTPLDAQLAAAAAGGRTADVRRLVLEGAHVNAVGDKGVTPLMWALVHGSTAGMSALLQAGADASMTDEHGETAVHIAAGANDARLLDTLIQGGVDLNVRDSRLGRTPLFTALMCDRMPQFRALIAAGADLNAADNMGGRPLHCVAQMNDCAAAWELLQAGADPELRNNIGNTFQTYLAIGPNPRIMSDDGKRAKQRIIDGLRQRGVPVDPKLQAFEQAAGL